MEKMSTIIMEKNKGEMGSLMTRANTGSQGMTSATTSTSASASASASASEDGPGPSLRSESSTSSIGQPDDDTDDDEEEEEEEVQSTLSSLASLEDSLPFNRRGLSKFYGGKSKSYGNLGEVRSLQDLGKSDNPFNKRRRTLMAYNLMFTSNSTSHSHNSISSTTSSHNSGKSSSIYCRSNNNNEAALFYAHSNHISMPLLPLAEDHDEDYNDDNDNGVDDDYCAAPTTTSFLPPVNATTTSATPTPTPTPTPSSSHHSNSHTS